MLHSMELSYFEAQKSDDDEDLRESLFPIGMMSRGSDRDLGVFQTGVSIE